MAISSGGMGYNSLGPNVPIKIKPKKKQTKISKKQTTKKR